MRAQRGHFNNSGCLPGMEGFIGKMELDRNTKEAIAKLEAGSRFPTGIGRVQRGECPLGAIHASACALCVLGHMLECHYPQTCSQAGCDHSRRGE